MKRTNSNEKAATPRKAGAASKTNARHLTPCACVRQLLIEGFPQPPAPGEGPLAEYLAAHPGWHSRAKTERILRLTERAARDQAEHSGGRIIFGSRQGQGRMHIIHADRWEVRACIAELHRRAGAQQRRAAEIEQAFAEIGGKL